MAENPQAPQGGTGLAPNVAGALAYFLGPITGILFLVIEKQSAFVRFHAAQSIAVSVAWVILWVVMAVLSTVLAVVPIIGLLISLVLYLVIGLGAFILWLALMFRAYQGAEWELPVIGPQARKLLSQPAV
jgi:uncharacterized membrane protein